MVFGVEPVTGYTEGKGIAFGLSWPRSTLWLSTNRRDEVLGRTRRVLLFTLTERIMLALITSCQGLSH